MSDLRLQLRRYRLNSRPMWGWRVVDKDGKTIRAAPVNVHHRSRRKALKAGRAGLLDANQALESGVDPDEWHDAEVEQ